MKSDDTNSSINSIRQKEQNASSSDESGNSQQISIGYKNRKTGKLVHHAESQTERPLRHPVEYYTQERGNDTNNVKDDDNNDTEDHSAKITSKYCQTYIKVSTSSQMSHDRWTQPSSEFLHARKKTTVDSATGTEETNIDLLLCGDIDDDEQKHYEKKKKKEKILIPNRFNYITAKDLEHMKLKGAKIIQRVYRGFKGRLLAKETFEDEKKEFEQIQFLKKQNGNTVNDVVYINELERRLQPQTKEDFDTLHRELEQWYKEERLNIARNFHLYAASKQLQDQQYHSQQHQANISNFTSYSYGGSTTASCTSSTSAPSIASEMNRDSNNNHNNTRLVIQLRQSLLEKETKILHKIDTLKLQANKRWREKRIKYMLNSMAQPKKWKLVNHHNRKDGPNYLVNENETRSSIIKVHTPHTLLAKKLKQLYESLVSYNDETGGVRVNNNPAVSTDEEAIQERLTVLLEVKQIVNKPVIAQQIYKSYIHDNHDDDGKENNESSFFFSSSMASHQLLSSCDCILTRDISDLIDREADLLHRRRSQKTLSGLRVRLSNLFLQYIETPEFNPEYLNYMKYRNNESSSTAE